MLTRLAQLAPVALLVVHLAAASPARAGLVYAQYLAGTTNANTTTANVYPPAMWGWVDQNTTGAATPAINEGGSGLNGWIVTDTVAGLPNPNYVTELNASATTAATTVGFKFEAYARYIGDYGGAANQGLSIYLNQRAYHLMFDLTATGDLQATRYGVTGTTVLTAGGTGAAGYHKIALQSSGGTSVTALFDGQPIGSPWTGITFSQQHANIMLWGNSNQALSARGAMSFNKVTFELGPILEQPADFNDDAVVDGADLLLWQKTVGSTTQLAADANGDHAVNGADLAIWSGNYGSAAPLTAGSLGASTADVPEPASAQLALITAAALSAAWRLRLRRMRY